MSSEFSWQPSASIEILQQRATLLRQIEIFFISAAILKLKHRLYLVLLLLMFI